VLVGLIENALQSALYQLFSIIGYSNNRYGWILIQISKEGYAQRFVEYAFGGLKYW
jgi:hypothetical protein